MNETARAVDLAKALERPIVVSEEAASRARRPFIDLGQHDLRGLPAPRCLWALEVPPA
ncbi:MAG: hypothetical protein R6X03_08685 [Methyloceanibacter sp.]|jgi:hypothetical protein